MAKVISQKTVEEYGEGGEIKKTTITAIIGKPAQWEKDGNFLKIYPAFLKTFLDQMGITDSRLSLVMYIMNEAIHLQINGDNAIFLDCNKAAKVIKVSVASIYRGIKSLVDCSFLKQINPRQSVYRINPEMVYRGNLIRYYQKELKSK